MNHISQSVTWILAFTVLADEEKTTLAYDYAETVLPTVFAGAAEQVRSHFSR